MPILDAKLLIPRFTAPVYRSEQNQQATDAAKTKRAVAKNSSKLSGVNVLLRGTSQAAMKQAMGV